MSEKVRDFCVECGCHFPPRDGEGCCPGWALCQTEQAKIMNENPDQYMWRGVDRAILNGLFRVGCIVFVILFILAMAAGSVEASPPTQSLKYRNELIRNARVVWGLGAPIALFAGQIQQESNWRPDVSSAYAHGLAQFTPDTSEWISNRYKTELGANQPFNPSWALRALIRYDYFLHTRIRGDRPCDRWAMVLSAYNGGLGWLLRDKNQARENGASPYLWFDHVERYSPRAKWAYRENRQYPRNILLKWQQNYQSWGKGVDCDIE